VEDADESAQEISAEQLPDDPLIYMLPSRYCLPDVLADEAWSLLGAQPPGYTRVQAICDQVHSHLTFQCGSSAALSTPRMSTPAGWGSAGTSPNLAISFCRAFNIPARYVFGSLPDMDVPADPAPGPWSGSPSVEPCWPRTPCAWRGLAGDGSR
jgi:transglutaminase-like putative cysteine protease